MRQGPLWMGIAAVMVAGAAADGCSAAGSTRATSGTTSGSGGTGVPVGATGIVIGSSDAGVDATDPCGTECGPVELCDPAHTGLDDNCNGEVDEGCSCTAGQVHWCFEGDPAYRDAPGCHDGTETCGETGTWGPCIGGVGAYPPDSCQMIDAGACHAITTEPFVAVHLATGTGQLGAGADAGSETYAVQCPTGVSQCPSVTPPDVFTPIQSGEYTVTYTSGTSSCTFPLFVWAPGLRVELTWEHTTADTGVDLDLHLHQPPCNTDGEACSTSGDCCSGTCNGGGVCGTLPCSANGVACTIPGTCCSGACTGGACAPIASMPWGVSPAVPQDCMWNNCMVADFMAPIPPFAPHWFPDSNTTPEPVDWDEWPNYLDNTCYSVPGNVGAEWTMLDMGCHDPRMDLDDVTCDFSIADPSNPLFCNPENANVDYPPERQWMRIGVHYYWNHGHTYDVHPEVKVFCDGDLWADLGPLAFDAPVTFTASDGMGVGTGNRFWVVADVAYASDGCGHTTCVVKPIHPDHLGLRPFFVLDTEATSSFEPAWPPPP